MGTVSAFPADVTKYHSQAASNHGSSLSHSGGPKSNAPSRGSRGGSLLPLQPLCLQELPGLWLGHPNLCLCHGRATSLWVCLQTPSYVRSYSLFPCKAMFTGFWGSGYIFGGSFSQSARAMLWTPLWTEWTRMFSWGTYLELGLPSPRSVSLPAPDSLGAAPPITLRGGEPLFPTLSPQWVYQYQGSRSNSLGKDCFLLLSVKMLCVFLFGAGLTFSLLVCKELVLCFGYQPNMRVYCK